MGNACTSTTNHVNDPSEVIIADGFKKEPKSSTKDFFFSYTLGKGGFGKVVAGYHISSGKWCAVKNINLNFRSKRKYAKHMNMIKNEIEALSLCKDHPYVCNLHCSFQELTSIYLVMDLHVGGDLRYHLDNGEMFSEQTSAFIVTCMASALRFMHKKNIIHRDIKPDNIVFDEYGFPSLTDFGICHIFDTQEKQQVCRLSSGTREYAAPEVLTSMHLHDSAVDYWGLGLVAYELVYGQRPFDDGCPEDFVEYNELLQQMDKQYDDTSFELKMKCSKQPPLKKKSALKLLIPNRPFVVMPRHSMTTGLVVSSPCRSTLRGLLDVRPGNRLNYKDLSMHEWFKAQGCVWEKIIHCEVVPPFEPDIMEISRNVQDRHHNISITDSCENKDDELRVSKRNGVKKGKGGYKRKTRRAAQNNVQ